MFSLKNVVRATLLLIVAHGVAVAETIDVPVTADAHASSSSPNANYGSTPDVRADAARVGGFRFDLSGISPDSTVTSAHLELPVASAAAAGSLNVLVLLESWGEQTLTWNAGPNWDESPVATFSVSGADVGGTVSVDLTGLVGYWIRNPQSNFGVALPRSAGSVADVAFASRETGDGARLVLVLEGGDLAVPDVLGLTVSAAQASLAGQGLTVGPVSTVWSDTVPVSQVMSQTPAAGALVAPGTEVALTVSDGPAPINEPPVANDDLDFIVSQATANTLLDVLANDTDPDSPVGSLVILSVSVPNQGGAVTNDVTTLTYTPAPDFSGTETFTYTVQDPTLETDTAVVSIMVSPAVSGSVVIPVAADAHASGSAPNTNYGSALDVRTDGNRVSGFRFDLSSIEPGTAISSAQLELPVLDVTGAGSLNVLALLEPWGEQTLTWNTGPEWDPSPRAVVPVSAGDIGGVVSVDLTALVEWWVQNPQANFGVALPRAYGSGATVAFASRETGDGARLVIGHDVELLPVPGVIGLTQQVAESALIDAGLAVGAVTMTWSATVPAGEVVEQTPDTGDLAAPGAAVALVVSGGPEPVAVPPVAGMTQPAATATLAGAGLSVGAVTTAWSSTVTVGEVIEQTPSAGDLVVPGTTVALVISDGPEPVAVPPVAGMTQPAATSTLAGAGLSVGAVTTVWSDTVPPGQVIGQTPPAGDLVAPGTAVALVVSDGPQTIMVPAVTGMTESAAAAALNGAGLTVGAVTTAWSDTVAAGQVMGQTPPAGDLVAPGTAVALVVSDGPQTIMVPAVTGMTESAAAAALNGAGLTVGAVTSAWSDTTPVGVVVDQAPGAGTFLLPGEAVSLNVSQGPEPQPEPPEAVDDVAWVIQQGSVDNVLDVLANDNDVDSPAGSLVILNIGAPDHGGSVFNDVTVLRYTPAPDFSGTETFTYVVADPDGGQDSATVRVTVSPAVAGGQVIGVTADAYASSNSPNANYGSALDVRTDAARVGGFRFDLSGVSPDSTLISAQLELPVASVTAAGSLDVLVLLGAWAEQTLTWNTGPEWDPSPRAVVPVSAGDIGGVVSVDLTALVEWWVQNPQANFGVALPRSTGSSANVAIASRESGDGARLVLVLGVDESVVPDVVGLTVSAAQTSLTGQGLTVGPVSTVWSDTVPAGEVTAQVPAAGASVAPGTDVALVVSDGPEPDSFPVPALIGLSEPAAASELTDAGLTLGAVTTTPSATAPAGQVIDQTPAAGTPAAEGSPVALVVSTGAAGAAPDAAEDVFQVSGGTTTFLDVLANDTDPNLPYDTLVVVAVGEPDAGGDLVNTGASLSYTPAAGFAGTERFSYTIEDADGHAASAEVAVTVLPVGGGGSALSATAMMHYWRLDETVAGNHQNEFGGGALGCTSCPTTGDGRVAGGLSFDGSPVDLSLPDGSSLNGGAQQNFSVEAWMRSADGCPGTQVLVGRIDNLTQTRWLVGCDGGVATFSLRDSDGGEPVAPLYGTSDVGDGRWHHIVAVRDGALGFNRLYVDGVEQARAGVVYDQPFGAGSRALTVGWLDDGASGMAFSGEIDEVAIHNGAVSVQGADVHFNDGDSGLQRGYAGCSADVRIMPTGDSNTDHVGYRAPLWDHMTSGGYNLDFRGSESDSCGSGCGYDDDHEGHSGWTPAQIEAQIGGWLATENPDVVLLHIGTNELDLAGVDAILDRIDEYDERVVVVLARIIQRAYFHQPTAAFNVALGELAAQRIAAGDRIRVVDQESALTYPDDMVDDLHPNDDGYLKMSHVWADDLRAFLPACSAAAPRFESEPAATATAGQPYDYTPQVSGVPRAAFSLTDSPEGMTVHPQTGRVYWHAPAAGVHQVTLRAVNASGEASQTFEVAVD